MFATSIGVGAMICHLVNAYEVKTQACQKVIAAYRWGMT